MTHAEKVVLAVKLKERLRAVNIAGQLSVGRMIREDELTLEEIDSLISLYPDYIVGEDYAVGDIFSYDNRLYKVLQAHISQDDWLPNVTASLYTIVKPPNIIPEWVQPTGAHDAYQTGDKVLYNTFVWVSKIDSNTTVPDGDEPYNRYWDVE